MSRFFLYFLIAIQVLFLSCRKESENPYNELITGFWKQTSITIDGEQIQLSDCEQSTRLLIESNGVYRLYSSCDDRTRSGTWLTHTDNLVDLSLDRFNAGSYYPFPMRFTILKLTATELEIRIRTFVGERKKMVMFTPVAPDNINGLSQEEISQLNLFNKTIKTYIYRFSKQ